MRVGTRIGAVFLVTLIVAATLALVSWRALSDSGRTTKSVNRTNEVLKTIDLVLEDLVDVETGSRGYAITGQSTFLEPHDRKTTQSAVDISTLQRLVDDNPRQAELAARLRDVAQRRVDIARRTVALRDDEGADAAAALIATGTGEAATREIRSLVAAMRAEENQLLAQRMARSDRSSRRAIVLVFASMGVLVLLMSFGTLWLTLSITRPLVMLVNGARQFGMGEVPALSAAARRDEVGDLARELLEMFRLRSRAEAHLRALIDLAPDAFFLADLDARLTDVNQAACLMLGYDRDELIGKTIFDIIPPEDAPRLSAAKTELLVPGRVSKAEWTQRRKDGTFVPVEVSSNILPDGRWQAFVRDITERKRDREALQESEQRFRTLAESLPQIVWMTRPDGSNTYFNQQWVDYTGLTLEESRGHGWNIPFHPDDQQRAWEAWQRAVATDGVYSLECRLRRKDGTYHWWLIRGVSLHDKSGAVSNWFGTCTDIEEIKLSEEALRQAHDELSAANERLRQSEERFRLTLDEAPIGMALVSLDGRFVRVNRALCELVGYGADELAARRFQDITHPDDLGGDLALAAQLRRGEIPRYQLEKRYLHKDGSSIDVMLSASILRGQDGAPLYYIAQIEGITARKRAEEALRLSEAKFSGIVSIAADAIVSVDEDQRITIFNGGAEKIFGYSKLEALGKPLDILVPERLRAIHRQHFERFAASNAGSRALGERADVVGLRKNGEEFPAEASISKVVVDGATLFSVVMRDITQRKMAEEELRRAVTARDQVLGVVAHDLRNPLSTILMQASAMQRRGEEETARRSPRPWEIISRAATRMNHLIQDLLDVTRMEQGQLKIERERLSTSDVAREVVETQTALASSQSIELRLDLQRDLPDVLADRDRLLQVFENLIGNALKFTKAGRITVGAASRGHEVVFWVADTGCGIAPENLPHVFDRFWQATTGAARLGAGLGLPITKGIIESHGGRIWVESTPNRGTTFFFTIPAALREEDRASDVMH